MVLDAVAALGLRPDGRLLALSSYENRVYQVWLEDEAPVVAKFYRPGRWTEAQIDEEHAFARELAEREIPVVAPTHKASFAGFVYAVYPRRGGRTPELGDPRRSNGSAASSADSCRRRHEKFHHRESLTVQTFGHDARAYLLEHDFVPADLLDAWKAVTEQALTTVEAAMRTGEVKTFACTATAIRATSCGPTRAAFRRPRRRAHGARDAGPVDAALRRRARCPLN